MSKKLMSAAKTALIRNPHPGEILLEEFLKPIALSQSALARAVRVAPRRIKKLARYLGLSEGFFLGLQMDFQLMQRRGEIDRELKKIRPRAA